MGATTKTLDLPQATIDYLQSDDGSPGANWNPIRGCSRHSPGCQNCFAERIAARFSDAFNWKYSGPKEHPQSQPFSGYAVRTRTGPRWTGRIELIESQLEIPLHWRKPRRILTCSMSDLFHESLPDEAIDRVFAVMALCPWHTFMVLTKRAERMRKYVNAPHAWDYARPAGVKRIPWPLPNVWLGVSCEDQQRADERIPLLLQTPAARRWVSLEPLLESVDLHTYMLPRSAECRMRPFIKSLDWVICGAETGPGARPANLDWFRSIRDQCRVAGVPMWLNNNVLDGEVIHERPEVRP
jgi:protein gp37